MFGEQPQSTIEILSGIVMNTDPATGFAVVPNNGLDDRMRSVYRQTQRSESIVSGIGGPGTLGAFGAGEAGILPRGDSMYGANLMNSTEHSGSIYQ